MMTTGRETTTDQKTTIERLLDDEQVLDRFAGNGAVRMVFRIAERVEHHHAVGHSRINRAEPILAVEPFDDPLFAQPDRPFAQPFGPQAIAPGEHPVEPVEEQLPAQVDMIGLTGKFRRLSRK